MTDQTCRPDENGRCRPLPEGAFTQQAPQIVEILLRENDDDPFKALHHLVSFMFQEKDKLQNVDQLIQAKDQLAQMAHVNPDDQFDAQFK